MKVKFSFEMDIDDADVVCPSGLTHSEIIANQLKNIIHESVNGGYCYSRGGVYSHQITDDLRSLIGSCGPVAVETQDKLVVTETGSGPNREVSISLAGAVDDPPITECPQSKAFRAFIVGSALAGAASSDMPPGVLVEKAFKLAEESVKKL